MSTQEPNQPSKALSNVTVNVDETPVEVTVGFAGPQGPKGDKGDAGEVQYEELSYVHIQSVASDTWVITHGLPFIPNITVIDSARNVVEGSYSYSEIMSAAISSLNADFSFTLLSRC